MDIWHGGIGEVQDGSARSYIGGIPMLPPGLGVPIHAKTATAMTFFFQIEMPAAHRWGGHIVSVFAVTDDCDRDSFIPKLATPLAGARLSARFFEDYQTFFRIIVFRGSEGRPADDYVEKVAFRELRLSDAKPSDAVAFGRLAAEPEWLLDDESPASFDGCADAVTFLFQTAEDYEFATVADAPRQKRFSYAGIEGALEDSDAPEYTLFTANALFVFGIDADEKLIYVVPQS